MKKISLIICSAALLISACNSKKTEEKDKTTKDTTAGATTTTTSDTKVEPMTMPDSATMMKNWQAYMTPGEPQKMLAKSDGKWISEVTMWQKPDAPPQKSTGMCVNKMILGGRYQEGTNTGNMMGMPFEGRSITGYDNAKKVYVSSWIDNMGTGIMNMEGVWDDASKSIVMKGKGVDPMTMKESDYREVFKIVDDNTQMMEMYGPGPDGKETKMMEIKFTRKK